MFWSGSVGIDNSTTHDLLHAPFGDGRLGNYTIDLKNFGTVAVLIGSSDRSDSDLTYAVDPGKSFRMSLSGDRLFAISSSSTTAFVTYFVWS